MVKIKSEAFEALPAECKVLPQKQDNSFAEVALIENPGQILVQSGSMSAACFWKSRMVQIARPSNIHRMPSRNYVR